LVVLQGTLKIWSGDETITNAVQILIRIASRVQLTSRAELRNPDSGIACLHNLDYFNSYNNTWSGRAVKEIKVCGHTAHEGHHVVRWTYREGAQLPTTH